MADSNSTNAVNFSSGRRSAFRRDARLRSSSAQRSSRHEISDALPFGRLCYGGANAASNAVSYAMHYSRSRAAVIRVYDDTSEARRTYSGVGDGLGEVVSIAGDGVGEAASAAGNTALPDIFVLSCHWRCKSSGPSCRWAGRSCFAGSPAVPCDRWDIIVESSCIILSFSASI